MLFEYTDVFHGNTHNIQATITTESSMSSYGQPVILLDDGGTLNFESYILLNYRLKKATGKEKRMFNTWLNIQCPIGFNS